MKTDLLLNFIQTIEHGPENPYTKEVTANCFPIITTDAQENLPVINLLFTTYSLVKTYDQSVQGEVNGQAATVLIDTRLQVQLCSP
jgi:hypothetical protein